MKTPSVFWAEVIMPFLRAKIAEILYSKGMPQSKIGEHLGITQAMVSKYLSGSYKKLEGSLGEKVERIANSVAEMIFEGAKKEDLVKFVEAKFFEMLADPDFCMAYERYSGISGIVCQEIIPKGRERREILELLSIALRSLLEDEKFPSLIPEIRSNFAYALPNPRGPEDVAAIPGRITVVRGRAFAMPPEFGVSRHTARLLVKVSNVRPEVRSVLNIRAGGDVEEALKRADLRVAFLKKERRSEEETEDAIAALFRERELDAVVDRGGFGIEPCVYIFGSDPFDVLKKLRRIEENL
ncbi:thiamine-phosphate synthase family protein [Pyrococcus yayanosii]|uniref:Phosphomethylpyrimidine kinase n=1 Tax=Pyrococcus yayanosii (strain CH1 / JCM 16557) TaxID=529709 RepID=F8AIW0_PYRYC|nr:thiamine-phosphate synthase family protein [Pyrococcus yayanosii]AEH24435.1 phosphomethylpyrimidine kinase [Pyrococcus yayanosii CH1]